MPHAPEILRRIKSAVETMLACLPAAEGQPFLARLAKLALPALEHGALAGGVIDAMTSGDRKAGDSLHLLVMDAHRAINSCRRRLRGDGRRRSRPSACRQPARRRVEAFMGGLNRTAPLKFDHPGLGTTATEHDGQLLIQNDIGTTDAHVLVVRVDGLASSVTYTDIHAPG